MDNNTNPQITGTARANNDLQTPTLEKFGRDLSRLAREGKLTEAIGREKEVQNLAQALSRKMKSNAVLVGGAGVGKTCIVEHLAILINNGTCPANLIDKRIIEISLGALIAGTKFRGAMESRIQAVIKEASAPNIILFFDEIHTIMGLGSSGGSMDMSNLIKPALARGEIRVIGATTTAEYLELEKDKAFTRRFMKITVNEPSFEDTVSIMLKAKTSYEKFHNIEISDDLIVETCKMSRRYITDKFSPDRELDILDLVGAKLFILNSSLPQELRDLKNKIADLETRKMNAVRAQSYEEAAEINTDARIEKNLFQSKLEAYNRNGGGTKVTVTKEDLAGVIHDLTSIDISKLTSKDTEKLANLESELKKSVMGQDEALETVAKAVRRSRAGLGNPNKPKGVFLFLGSTGVGKCMGKGTPILMHDGEVKNVEDVEEGDLLMGDDSSPRKVLSLARGTDNLYRITPIKGESFVCNESHVLSLKDTVTNKIVNIPLNEYLEKNKTFKHRKKLWRTGVEFKERGLKIDPYFMGLWIGDGHSNGSVCITTMDEAVVDEIKYTADKYSLNVMVSEDKRGNKAKDYFITDASTYGQNSLQADFRHYNLIGTERYRIVKSIPKDYLINSRENRLKLLAGLIDSDGFNSNGCAEIATVNYNISRQILFLCRSLGFAAYSKVKVVKDKDYYRIVISGDLSVIPTRVPRRRFEPRLQKKNVLHTGFSIESIGQGEYYGFELGDNHLYLLGDFTVTHNTQCVKALAQTLFNSSSDIIRLDMGEYQEGHTVSKLIGSPAGYVGYGEGGKFTEQVRHKPYSIILLDEVEKAHPDVWNSFLSVFDEGRMTDGMGRTIDFRNTIIIMTSNTGARKARDFSSGIGYSTSKNTSVKEERQKGIILKELKGTFSPEFLNRIDDIVMFNNLDKETIRSIVDLNIDKVILKVKELGFNYIIDDSIRQHVAEVGFDEELGARPILRAITHIVEDAFSEFLFTDNPAEGSTIELKMHEDGDGYDINVIK